MMIRIGFFSVAPTDEYSSHTIIRVDPGGKMIFESDAHIGQGAILNVRENGELRMGRNFAISGSTKIICNDKISIGDNVQFAYSILVMDSDGHSIYDTNGERYPNTAPIKIGNKVWIAPYTSILKGASIPDNCIIAQFSLINKKFKSPKHIIGGIPAKEIKEISKWEL